MNTISSWLKSAALIAGIILSASPVHADDTEIYFSNPNQSSNVNIMVMLDTSGSMAWCGSTTSSCNDPDLIRMEQLKKAFKGLLAGLGGNVNMGLGRLQGGDGGYILYPVRGLNEPLIDLEADLPVSGPQDDAIQTTTSDASGLAVTGNTMLIPNGGVAGGQSGFIFRNLTIPRHAIINSAVLEVQSSANDNDALDMLGSYQVGAGLPGFAAQPFNVRTWLDSIALQVPNSDSWGSNTTEKIDVTDLIKRAVIDADWCGGGDIALKLQSKDPVDTLSRAINAYDRISDNNSTYKPVRLKVDWDLNGSIPVGTPGTAGYESTLSCKGGVVQAIEDSDNDADQQGSRVRTNNSRLDIDSDGYAAYRFPTVNYDIRSSVAEPDVLNSATLYFSGAQATQVQTVCVSYKWNGSCKKYQDQDVELDSGTVTLQIKGVAGDAAVISTSDGDISSRSVVSTIHTMTVSASSTDFRRQYAVDVTAMVKDMMSQGNWAQNGALMFIIRSTNAGSRTFSLGSQDGGAASTASLELSMSSPDQKRGIPLVRDKLLDIVNGLSPNGGTPLAEAHSEMVSYMMGMSTYFGSSSSAPESKSGSRYISPIAGADNECASNHIVMMTDGVPNSDSTADNRVVDMTGRSIYGTGNYCDYVDDGYEEASFACMREFASWSLDANDNPLKRRVSTHMVGFYLNNTTLNYMRQVTNAGEGKTVGAESTEELQNAFASIVNDITQSNAAMAAPSVTVNQLNRFETSKDIYYGLFRPSTSTRWEGNVKRFAIDFENAAIVDEKGRAAVNPSTGFFYDSSDSFWAGGVDGGDIFKGGARVQLGFNTRKLLVATTSPDTGSPTGLSTPPGVGLMQVDGPEDVTPAQLGMGNGYTTADRAKRVEFLLNAWGDPLHPSPIVVNYGLEDNNGNTTSDDVLFTVTNDGMLIATDPDDGSEYFTFMPAEEVIKTEQRYVNAGLTPPDLRRTTYGLDNDMTYWVLRNASGNVSKVMLFLSQRRGGRNYYAIDVTNRNNPKLVWSIIGGTGDFSNLGQSWSQPTLAALDRGSNSADLPVLIFGGGYSADDHDTAGSVSTGDKVGNGIYIVNAYTGGLILKADSSTNSDMKWSIAASPTVVPGPKSLDTATLGLPTVKAIYAADLGGQIFRIDVLKNSAGEPAGFRQNTIAKLGISAGSGITDHRRFYAAPDIALAADDSGKDLRYQVVIGSGYRAHPTDKKTQDMLFVINDRDLLKDSPTTSPVVLGDLYDATSTGTTDTSGPGWYRRLGSGEKVLAQGAVFQYGALMTSYLPEAVAVDNCSSVIGATRLYGLDTRTGAPSEYLVKYGVVDADGTRDVALTGLPPKALLLTKGKDLDGDGTVDAQGTCVLVGTQLVCGPEDPIFAQRGDWEQVPSEEAGDQVLLEKSGRTAP